MEWVSCGTRSTIFRRVVACAITSRVPSAVEMQPHLAAAAPKWSAEQKRLGFAVPVERARRGSSTLCLPV
eukprot:8729358-Alexandrium_andersonii.AAC.1